jgi:hypothetical protein
MLGAPSEQSIGIASLRDGRLMERHKRTSTNAVTSLSASGDGKILFYSEARSIWSIPSAGGEPHSGFVVASRDSWFLGAAVLDPESGIVRRVPLRYDGDITRVSWNAQNEIVAAGSLMRGAIWRFRPAPGK